MLDETAAGDEGPVTEAAAPEGVPLEVAPPKADESV